MLNYRQTNHLLTVLALLSCFSFAGIGDKENQWFWLSMRVMGAGCAVAAVYGYSQEEKDAELNNESTRLLDAVGDVKQGHDWEKYQLALNHTKEIESFERAIAQLHQQLEVSEQPVFEQTETANERLALEYHRLQQEREQHAQEKALLDEHWDTQQQSLEAQQQALQEREETHETAILEEYRSRIEALQEKELALELQEKQMLEGFEREWTEREGFYSQIADAAIQEAQNLKQPDLPAGGSPHELLARDAIKFLREHGIIAKHTLVKTLPKQRFEVLFSVLPITPTAQDSSGVRNLAEAYKKIEKELLKPLRTVVIGCNSDPSVEPISLPFSGLKLTFDVSGIDWDARQKVEKLDPVNLLPEPPPEHFEDFIRRAPHIGFFGATRVGKTVGMNNVIGVMQKVLGDNATLIVGDAKLSAELKALRPRYLGAKECLHGLRDASNEVQHRIDLRHDDYNHNRPLRTFDHDKRIYLFDEINEVIRRFNNPVDPDDIEFLQENDFPRRFAVSTYLMRIWQMGAELAVMSLIAGQNLMAQTLKINIVDLENVGLMYLGGAISVGINYRCKGSEKNAMEQEFETRRELKEQFPDDPKFKFYAMFANSGDRPYFARMPAPGHYAIAGLESGLEALKTPDLTEDSTFDLEKLWEMDSEEFPDDEL